MTLCESEDIIAIERDKLIEQHKKHLGLVAVEVPLISNLSVIDNISLIVQYHQNLPENEAKMLVLEYLKRYNLEHLALKRNPALDEEERFCVMLLRAAMVKDAFIIIDRPLKLLPDLEDNIFFYNVLTPIVDLFNECHIIDYEWNHNRYEMIYEAK